MRRWRFFGVVVALGLASGVIELAPEVAAAASSPVVTVDPVDVEVGPGASASFSSEATGDPTPVRSWEVSHDGGATWDVVGGSSGSTLTLSSVALAQDGDRYRAVYVNDSGSATSAAATLQVTVVPTVTVQPASTTAAFDAVATFTASADRWDRIVWERQLLGAA